MARRKRFKKPRFVACASVVAPQLTAKAWFIQRRIGLLAIAGLLTSFAVAAVLYIMSWPAPAPRVPVTSSEKLEAARFPIPAQHVGSGQCQQCHTAEHKAWKGSHHALAMQEANASTVLGDFNNTNFRHHDVDSTFFNRDGKYFVRTDGANGSLAEFEVKYTFGVTPLQQYLIEFPGGRFQALSIAWDARLKIEGGQRWFHLYPNDKIDHRDALHWTGLYQNWNLQCAACHSTNLRKNFDAAANNYKSTFSEINVACEACHGPGSNHVAWVKAGKQSVGADDVKALDTYLKSRWSEAWRFPTPDAKYAVRDKPAARDTMNVCWACHARRSIQNEKGPVNAQPFETGRPANLLPPLYHADGQQRDEVYTWGSFTQSKMYERGVTCMDCHEPHALKLRVEGNSLCGRCHNAAVFDTKQHHRHEPNTKGATCVNCHMPAQNYMVIDARRDHSFRLPRPDLASKLGSPDACTMCHANRKPEWAAEALDKWHGPTWRDRPHYATTLHAGLTEGAKGLPGLLALANDRAQPAIVRATAATLAQGNTRPVSGAQIERMLGDAEPSVRIAAIGLAEGLDPVARARLLAALVSDPIHGVRVEAARSLADVAPAMLRPDRLAARDRALKEYEASLLLDADWPTANVNLGNLRLRQGRIDDAIAAFQQALSLDPRLIGAYLVLADAYRQQNRDADGETHLRRGLQLLPQAADLHHALGLLLVRRGDKVAGVGELAEAAKLAPENPRYAYVYAIGLSSTEQRAGALAVLRDADQRHPHNLDILGALVSLNREAGDKPAALAAARKLADALPGDPNVARLILEMESR